MSAKSNRIQVRQQKTATPMLRESCFTIYFRVLVPRVLFRLSLLN